MQGNQQEAKKPQPVYMVGITIGGKTVHRVGSAENGAQAIRRATEGVVSVKTLTPHEVLSWAKEGKPFDFKDPELAKEIAMPAPAVGGLPAGDRTEVGDGEA